MHNGKASYERMDLSQLLKLRDTISQTINTRIAEERRALQHRMEELGNLVNGSGATRAARGRSGRGRPPSVEKLVGRGPRRGTKVRPKYRGPEGETWSGRGLPPRWLSALEKSGKKREAYLIK